MSVRYTALHSYLDQDACGDAVKANVRSKGRCGSNPAPDRRTRAKRTLALYGSDDPASCTSGRITIRCTGPGPIQSLYFHRWSSAPASERRSVRRLDAMRFPLLTLLLLLFAGCA